jgi:flagellar motor switch protein FliG
MVSQMEGSMIDLFDQILSHLTDEDLAKMSLKIKEEQKRRVVINISSFPEPTIEEVYAYKHKQKLAALANYHNRTMIEYQVVVNIFKHICDGCEKDNKQA